jgi:hypothetical protein
MAPSYTTPGARASTPAIAPAIAPSACLDDEDPHADEGVSRAACELARREPRTPRKLGASDPATTIGRA